ncbi:flagellar hook capping FlgD N-terminal domain-containing protein [Conexibacter woesei]|uniref:Flagellar hook capping protein n=1 Tax=Conexibacter woesei (strain DSM 14684 / CCUG 47730 / CIP 108061 / JCM 11494 / NBRC 100937 / ID131577) TaxID=469383 RepID=D3F401_CONWI|nr:flagellar hook capping FlgD N-terminal domain-containing protein [Conexibacter woesei]ADB48484.1 flagellar hook capping protein [Conexibacter woesei DSM 14684]
MPVDPTNPVNNAPATYDNSTRRESFLGKDDFLKLLIGQMQNQDPLNPTDGAEYMGQMTQFSILEQITNLGQTTQAAASNDYDAQAIRLIGQTVSYLARVNEDGRSVLRSFTGRVESVTFTSSGPQLTIDGRTGILPVSLTKVGTDTAARGDE